MSDSILSDLMCALDLAGMERMPDSSFIALTPPPAWFSRAFTAVAAGRTITLSEGFPFLDNFLGEAEAFWRDTTDGLLVSGPFTVPDASGELLLRASAVSLGRRKLLVIARLAGDADTRPLLQKARESKLENERLMKRLDALQDPVKMLSRQVSDLLSTDLTDGQRRLAESIGSAVARVRAAASGSA